MSGSSVNSEGGVNVGHAAVMLDDGTYISFWPGGGKGYRFEYKYKRRGREGYSLDKIPIWPDQETVKKWFQQAERSHAP